MYRERVASGEKKLNGEEKVRKPNETKKKKKNKTKGIHRIFKIKRGEKKGKWVRQFEREVQPQRSPKKQCALRGQEFYILTMST